MTDMTEAGVMRPVRFGPMRRFAIVASLVLILAAVTASLFLARTVDSQLGDIAQAYEVRRQARELMLALVDAETGQRGYLLTQDQKYLEPYNRAVATLSDTYQGLLDLIRDNASQRLRIEGIGPEITAKRQELATTIELTSAGNVDAALAVARSDEGQALMDSIRSTLRGFVAEEDARLVERNAQMAGYRQGLVAAIVAALTAAGILAYALFARAQRQVAALAEQQSALVELNEQLEAHVKARTVEVEEARKRAEREQARLETLLQDTNHRIGNSLATVSSLLGLQLARSQSEEVRNALEAAQARVHAIASGHRRLRLGSDLETTNAAEFLDAVVDDLAEAVPAERRIAFHRDFEPLVIPARDATTLGIVVSELVTNAIKHAFADGREGGIWIRLDRGEDGRPRLGVEDDGPGLASETVSMGSGSGLGGVIIKQLALQFGGTVDYGTRPGGGTAILVHLPKLEVVRG